MTGGLELIKEAVEALSYVPDGDSCAKLFGKSNPSGDRIRRGEEQGMLVPLIVTLETSQENDATYVYSIECSSAVACHLNVGLYDSATFTTLKNQYFEVFI